MNCIPQPGAWRLAAGGAGSEEGLLEEGAEALERAFQRQDAAGEEEAGVLAAWKGILLCRFYVPNWNKIFWFSPEGESVSADSCYVPNWGLMCWCLLTTKICPGAYPNRNPRMRLK